jgi:hypothetical protein
VQEGIEKGGQGGCGGQKAEGERRCIVCAGVHAAVCRGKWRSEQEEETEEGRVFSLVLMVLL